MNQFTHVGSTPGQPGATAGAGLEATCEATVRLALGVSGAPIAFLALRVAGDLSIVACSGLDTGDFPAALALCAPALAQPSPFVVTHGCHDHPLVAGDPSNRFIASALVRIGGTVAGALCVLDVVDRPLADDIRQSLLDLASLAGQCLAPAAMSQGTVQLEDAIARQAQAEHMLGEREAELVSVIENARDAYVSHSVEGVVTGWNREAERTFGWSRQEAIGRRLIDLIIPAERSLSYYQDLASFKATGASPMHNRRLELPALRKDGSSLTIEGSVSALRVNGIWIFSCFMHDISERKQLEEQREYESRHDVLTGLSNRRALLEMLPLAQARARRSRRALAMAFLDLDGFKAVNDTWGHDAGDALLCAVAGRLVTSVRQSDMVFRLAGDEFTVLLEGLEQGCDAVTVADKLIAALAEPVPLHAGVAKVGASIGIAVYDGTTEVSAETLIGEADQWMYRAKRAGKGQVLPRFDGTPDARPAAT